MEKDKWDVRILHDKYGVDYNKSKSSYYLDFSKTDEKIREEVKKYFKNGCLVKQILLGFSTKLYDHFITIFQFCILYRTYMEKFKSLKRTHMEKYIEYLHDNSNKSKRPNSHPEMYVNKSLSIIQKFLEDIQRYEYDMAPENHVRLLIFPKINQN